MDEFSEINRKHWDDAARSYDSKPWQQEMLAQVTREILSHLEWIGVDWVKEQQPENTGKDHPTKTVRVLDYACGPGTVTRALAPHATQFRGIDVSENMVQEYNARAKSQGFSPVQMFAVQGDLLVREKPSASVSGPDFYDFDLAVVDLGFHHFKDPALAAKRLVERLKPGKGVLLIVDFVQHEHDEHAGTHTAAHHHGGGDDVKGPLNAAKHTIAHHGFTKGEIEGMFKDAGCVDVEYEVMKEPLKFGDEGEGQQRTAFMIRGRRKD